MNTNTAQLLEPAGAVQLGLWRESAVGTDRTFESEAWAATVPGTVRSHPRYWEIEAESHYSPGPL